MEVSDVRSRFGPDLKCVCSLLDLRLSGLFFSVFDCALSATSWGSSDSVGGNRLMCVVADSMELRLRCCAFSRLLADFLSYAVVIVLLVELRNSAGELLDFALLVWSLVRRFDQPQKYKPFVSRCVVQGDLEIGSVREVNVKSGLPATTSTERLEKLDDNEHILSVRIVGGDHRLRNYSSVITLHPEVIDGRPGTLVIESFVVDVPDGNTQDETCYFVEALIKCNLKSLADVSERLAVQDRTEPIDRY
ncbi:hypothetical protein ACLOJK_009994 [Asimina triloba]